MSSALREIIASFGVDFDTKSLARGDSAITGMIGKLKTFGTAAAGAFAVKEVLGFTFGLAEQAVELKHHAEALGISAQSLQQWDFAASLSGVSAEELQVGLQKLQRSAVGAGGKGGELGAVFSKLHVNVKNANGSFKNADELLTDVAGAIGDMTDPTLQTATAMQIFGRGGARLLPFLKQGRAGVAALKQEVAALGGGFTDDFIEKSEAMVQDSKRLEFAFLGLKVKGIGPLLPILTQLAEGATKWIVAGGEMLKKSNAAKAALVALGVGGAVALAPLLLSIAPIVAGFLALEDVLTFLGGGDSLTGDLIDKWFGPGASERVRQIAEIIKNDLSGALRDIFAIFTDGQPLDVKFRQLSDYITNILKPRFTADFGEMGSSVAELVNSAGQLAEALVKIIKAMGWIAAHTINAGDTIRKNAAAADAETAQHKANGGATWYDKLRDVLVPNQDDIRARLAAARGDGGPLEAKASATAPKYQLNPYSADLQYLLAPQANVATASLPGGGNSSVPEVNQSIQAPITQQFYGMQNEKDVGRAAAKGAAEGLKSGGNDRAMRALVPQAG